MNLASRDFQEKRSFIRMRVETPVAVHLTDQTPLAGTCHDICGGGMLISLPQSLPVGTPLEVLVSSNHGHNPVFRAEAEVNRIHSPTRSPSKNCYLGLKIIAIMD